MVKTRSGTAYVSFSEEPGKLPGPAAPCNGNIGRRSKRQNGRRRHLTMRRRRTSRQKNRHERTRQQEAILKELEEETVVEGRMSVEAVQRQVPSRICRQKCLQQFPSCESVKLETEEATVHSPSGFGNDVRSAGRNVKNHKLNRRTTSTKDKKLCSQKGRQEYVEEVQTRHGLYSDHEIDRKLKHVVVGVESAGFKGQEHGAFKKSRAVLDRDARGCFRPKLQSDDNEGCSTDNSPNNNGLMEAGKPELCWSTEQDTALQNAYLLVRPASNFWYEVSKKVPGKTAKECFDRFYSAYPTPPVTQPRSRKAAADSPIRSIAFSSPLSAVSSRKHFGRGKQGLLKAHKTVRHILRKQRVADGNYETDVFASVEQTDTLSPLPVLQDCTNLILSPLPGPASHFASSIVTPNRMPISSKQTGLESQILSPEVLKQESNPGRLDKYLDMLHLRRADKQKRSLDKGTSREKLTASDNSGSRMTHTVSTAREAILSDAEAMLRRVLQQQIPMTEDASQAFDDDDDNEEEELSAMLEV